MDKVTLAIDGMSCGHCVARVNKTLAALPGVKVDKVEIGSAVVELDLGRASVAAVTAALDDAGYPARASGAA